MRLIRQKMEVHPLTGGPRNRTMRTSARLSESVDLDNKFRGVIPTILASEISIVVPVKNNATGVDRFLKELIATHSSRLFPKEVVVVDNNSKIPLQINVCYAEAGLRIRIERCSKPGPAAARNAGVRACGGQWILFCDSDCIPTRSLLLGYLGAECPAVAYAGAVAAFPSSRLAQYYDAEETLLPYRKENSVGHRVPVYIVTANSLVWRKAFEACGGFDEEFACAGGEDVDLGRRLWAIGNIAYQPRSIVLHDFSDGWIGFCRRFARYGRGNRQMELKTSITMKPHLRAPKVRNAFNQAAMVLQYVSMSIGYYGEKYRDVLHSYLLSRRSAIAPSHVE